MPSVEDATFKALPETLYNVLGALKRGLNRYLADQKLGVHTCNVPLPSLRNLTLWTFVGSYSGFQEPAPTGSIPDLLKHICTNRAHVRQPYRFEPDPIALEELQVEWKTFNIIELHGIHCNSEWRRKLARYTNELNVDDPFDVELVPTSSDSDGYYSSEGEVWQASSERASEDGDSQKWHSSSASYTDEGDIDEESQGSSDDDVDDDAATDDLNIHAWGLADAPSEFEDDVDDGDMLGAVLF